METARTFNSAAPAGAIHALYIALELSRLSWVVAVQGRARARPALHKLAAGNIQGLLAIVERAHAAQRRAGAPFVATICCYEIGYDGFWLARRLVTHGWQIRVVEPASLQVDRRARRAKTDRLDVLTLMRALIGYEGGDAGIWRVVTVPTVAEEDRKRQHRERSTLIEEKGRHINRVKGMLAQQGVYDYEPALSTRWAVLEALRTGDGRALAPCLRRAIERELRRLEFVLTQIREVEAEQQEWLAVKADSQADMVRHLAGLRGVGWRSAAVVVNEALYRGFRNRRQLAAFAGLAPSPYMSGGMRREQGINKASNSTLRTTLVELAWLWLRYQPTSALTQWFQERSRGGSPRLKRIMIVALGRKLLVALWRYAKEGLIPQGATLKA
jgi:transposase